MKLGLMSRVAGPLVGVSVVAASLFGLSNLASSALFTDQESVLDNAFVTGQVDLSTSDAWAVLEAPEMLPGDVVVSPLEMTNEGTSELRYALTSSLLPPEELDAAGGAAAPDDELGEAERLAAQINLTVAVAPSQSACRAENFDNLPEVLYGPDDLAGMSNTAIFGDRSAGVQGGERVIAPGRSETLCMKVELPLETGNEFQNLATSAYLTAWAEQTRNNE